MASNSIPDSKALTNHSTHIHIIIHSYQMNYNSNNNKIMRQFFVVSNRRCILVCPIYTYLQQRIPFLSHFFIIFETIILNHLLLFYSIIFYYYYYQSELYAVSIFNYSLFGLAQSVVYFSPMFRSIRFGSVWFWFGSNTNTSSTQHNVFFIVCDLYCQLTRYIFHHFEI